MIKNEKTAIYIKLTSFDAEIGANKKKSHNEWAIPIGVAHFQNKQKYKSEFIKENIDETIFMFALFKCRKSDKGRN